MPDRIEFDLSSDKTEIGVGEPANVTVDGRFLYGAPAAGLALEGETTLSTTREWKPFKGYVFGLADEQEGDATRIPLADLPLVGDDGKATFPVQVDQVPATTRLLIGRRHRAHARKPAGARSKRRSPSASFRRPT